MGEGIDVQDVDGYSGMDLQGAADIVSETGQRARRELRVNTPLLYLVWGLSVFMGYGVLWLSVHDQRPYRGPHGGGVVGPLVLILLFGVVARAGLISRAETGVGGRSVRQWSIFVLALPAGTAAMWIVAGALTHAGVSRPVLAVLEFAPPMLSIGLVFVASSAAKLDWPRLGLGIWILAVAAAGAWAGPVTILTVYALAGCGGFMVAALVELRLRRS